MEIIKFIATLAFAFIVLCTSLAFAEDVDMSKAKVGASTTHAEWETLADGDTWESTITCTKVSARITKCVSTDELGWAETTVCVGAKCRIVAKR